MLCCCSRYDLLRDSYAAFVKRLWNERLAEELQAAAAAGVGSGASAEGCSTAAELAAELAAHPQHVHSVEIRVLRQRITLPDRPPPPISGKTVYRVGPKFDKKTK